ncbi:CagE, TrbE, VirB component of type IV transporter system, central domain [Candidatus Hepatincola sp. Av]
MLLALFYVLFCIICLFLARFIYNFLINFYKKPFLINSYAEFIPSESIDGQFIKNKNGNYSAVIKLKGYSYYRENDLEQAMLNNYKLKCRALNFNNLSENLHLKFVFKRYKVDKDSFENNYYIEITGDKKQVKETMSSLVSTLNPFSPEVLNNDELLQYTFLSCNLVKKAVHISDVVVNDLCSYSTINFNEDYGILQNVDTKKYFKVFSFNFGSEINSEFFKKLITANLEFDFIINTKFFTKSAMASTLSKDRKNISSSKREDGSLNISTKKANEIALATEILMNEEANLAMYDVFIVVYTNNEVEIQDIAQNLKEVVNNYDIFLVEETYLLNFFFLQKLCGFSLHHNFKFLAEHSDFLVYAKKVLSSTLVGMFDYIDTPKGLTKCDWGEGAIAKFNTHYNNLYNFNLHVTDVSTAVAHGVIIAPTGGGKTTFMQYIINGVLENFTDVDIYAFDRFSGIEVFSEYKNGNNIDFANISLNPLLLDLEVAENKTFLNTFLTMLAGAKSNQDMEIISNFVNMVALLGYEDRILKNLVEDYLPHSELKENIKKWIDGKYSQYITGAIDSINLDDGKFFTFQMDNILDDEELSAPIIYLMMFKIRQKARNTGRGHFIFIDESAKMVKNTYFKAQIEVLLQEHRKLRGAVWLAFQNPNAFLNEDLLRELILNQCQNQIVFSSEAINEDILQKLNIHNSLYQELQKAKKSNRNEYYVLLKRPTEGVILDVNLKPILGDNLKFYSSKTSDVNRMRKLKAEYGATWREQF